MHSNDFTDEEHESEMNRIVRDYGNAILRHCVMLLHDTSSAEDAAQESLIKIYRKLDSCRQEGSEKAWIMRVVTNTCRDYYRTAWFRHVDRHIDPADLNLPASPDEDDRQEHERNREIMKAVMSLNRPLQEVILLRYYQKMKISEIAQTLHLSESAVNKRLKKALEQLKPELREVFFDESV